MSPKQFQQIHLSGRGHSGRAVRYALLTSDQVDSIEEAAAREVGTAATNLQLWNRTCKLGLALMLVAVSDPVSDDKLAKARWNKVDPAVFEDSARGWFTAKDMKVLKRVFDDEHDVRASEVAAILGKAQTVLAE